VNPEAGRDAVKRRVYPKREFFQRRNISGHVKCRETAKSILFPSQRMTSMLPLLSHKESKQHQAEVGILSQPTMNPESIAQDRQTEGWPGRKASPEIVYDQTQLEARTGLAAVAKS
jgi:hypothetical protein